MVAEILGSLLMFGVFWLMIMAFFAIFGLAVFCFWIWMLIDCIKREEFNAIKGENAKMIWLLVLVFMGWIGAAAYFLLEKHGGKPSGTKAKK